MVKIRGLLAGSPLEFFRKVLEIKEEIHNYVIDFCFFYLYNQYKV